MTTKTKRHNPEIRRDTPQDGQMHVWIAVNDSRLSGAVGYWSAEQFDGDGGFKFGEKVEFQVEAGYLGIAEEPAVATCSIGGIAAHGSDVAYRRIEAYTLAAEIVKVAEGVLFDDGTYDEAMDAVIQFTRHIGLGSAATTTSSLVHTDTRTA